MSAKRRRILFLASDPSDTARLRLGEEQREIQNMLQLAHLRNRFQFSSRHAVRVEDLTQAILDFKPDMLHFSGHGTARGGLCFESADGRSHIVKPEALRDLFSLVSDSVECVVLNACYSEGQADHIAKSVHYVVGMSDAIGDAAAISFSVGFYQALGAGKSIEEAFRFGCVQIRLRGIPEHLTPVLKSKAPPLAEGQEQAERSGDFPKKRAEPKFFYYISKQKVEMLGEQLLTGRKEMTIVSAVSRIAQCLRDRGDVVPVDRIGSEGGKYISDNGVWRQGLFGFDATGEDVLTYVAWREIGSCLILLVGSPRNILGEQTVKAGVHVPGTSGALLAVLSFVENTLKTDEPSAVLVSDSFPDYISRGRDAGTTADPAVEVMPDLINISLPTKRDGARPRDHFFTGRYGVYRSVSKAFSPGSRGIASFCRENLSDLPPAKIETVFKIYSTSDSQRVIIGSPLYIALD